MFWFFQLTLKRSSTLELEDVQEDVIEDVDIGKGWMDLSCQVVPLPNQIGPPFPTKKKTPSPPNRLPSPTKYAPLPYQIGPPSPPNKPHSPPPKIGLPYPPNRFPTPIDHWLNVKFWWGPRVVGVQINDLYVAFISYRSKTFVKECLC